MNCFWCFHVVGFFKKEISACILSLGLLCQHNFGHNRHEKGIKHNASVIGKISSMLCQFKLQVYACTRYIIVCYGLPIGLCIPNCIVYYHTTAT